jgi:Peptidase family M28
LTNIQPYSGWRSSATTGEGEALDYVANILGDLTYLRDSGMELERQSFHVFLATELWENRLYLTTAGQESKVPASAPRGHRHDLVKALRFDSDGHLNDSELNPVEVAGQVLLIHSAGEIDDLSEGDARGKIAFLDSAVIGIDPEDRRTSSQENWEIVARLIDKGVAGLVVVTRFSTVPMGSQGKFIGDGAALEGVTTERVVPALYIQLEDLASAGISSWEDLAQIESARLVWDADVFSPGTSGNLVARIPGADSSQAIILGAHIDSANSPGAMDNGINAVALLEVARILNESRTQPPVDLYLVWFGSEELGICGSQYFVNTHRELLDQTAAALLMDGIIVSTPGPTLILDGWSYSRFGNSQLAFPKHLAKVAASQGITIDAVEDRQGILSDNSVFSGFVTQAGFAFGSKQGDYAHSPYDTVKVAQDLGDLMEQVTAVALIAAMETDPNLPGLRVTPEPDRRALIVASHTEDVHMTPAMLIDLVRGLAWEGFHVDVIPYGQAVTSADLADTELVILLPVVDYPSPAGDLTVYDEAWSEPEIESLVTYVEQGGLLVLTNSARRPWLGSLLDANEDWPDINTLSEHFGVVFEEGTLSASSARTQQGHPLMEGQWSLALLAGNAISFTMQSGDTLAAVGEKPVVGLVDHGAAGGQVLVLADVGILGFAGSAPEGKNLAFVRNLARYARTNGGP